MAVHNKKKIIYKKTLRKTDYIFPLQAFTLSFFKYISHMELSKSNKVNEFLILFNPS